MLRSTRTHVGIGSQDQSLDTFQSISNFVAGEAIGTLRIVYKSAGKVFIADESTFSEASKVIGLTLQNVVLDSNVDVLQLGEVTDASFSFTEGESIFLSSSGTLTQTTLGLSNVLKVGKALDTDRIFIDIEPIHAR